MTEKVVLAYSGGLDTSAAIHWLAEKYDVDVITLTIDVGNEKDFTAIREKALKVGAIKAIVIDAKDMFVKYFLWPALQANALYEGQYPLATALSRPLMAKLLVDTALDEDANAVAHGCTGKGNDQVRFDVGVHALAPQLKVLAPAREWGMTRAETIAYAQKHNIPIPITKKSPYSIDECLWGRSIETGVLEDPWVEPPADVWVWTKSPDKAPDKPLYVEISFEKGIPVSLDNEEIDGVTLINRLNQLAGDNGVGRIDHIENRLVGIKSREVYEAPAATVLLQAHQALEAMTLSKDQLRFKQRVAIDIADIIYNGLWFSAQNRDLSAYIQSSQRFVTGTIRMKLFKGHSMVVGRVATKSLYNLSLATYDKGDKFDQSMSIGFIHIWGLPVATQAQVQLLGDIEGPLSIIAPKKRLQKAKPDKNTRKRNKTYECKMSQIRGRFSKELHKLAQEYTQSLDFDIRLGIVDVLGSIAHVTMLANQGILTKVEAKQIRKALEFIAEEILDSKFPLKSELEDIHMNIEARLIEKVGDVGRKLHTARSRNDQVATDTRLFLMGVLSLTLDSINDLQETLVNIAEKNIDTVMPGYTHLQRAQPILLAHYLLAYYEMLKRDAERFIDCWDRTSTLPLGSGALAGVSYPINREFVAKKLGFEAVSRNSIDAVSDRDFILEFEFDAAVCMMHLSRLAEELVLWSTSEFDFIEIDDAFTTGSSIMPQKKNPDVAELARGKTGRIYGNLMALLTTMKGLPLAYDRDMQEDKEGMLDTADTMVDTLDVFSEMLKTIKVNTKKMGAAARQGYLLATDIADYLVKKGEPFRSAHEKTTKLVRYATGKNKGLTDLTLAEYHKFSDKFEKDVLKITIESSIASRDHVGGTAKKQVVAQIAEAREKIERAKEENDANG